MYKQNEELSVLEMFIDEVARWSIIHKMSCIENYLGLAYMYAEGNGAEQNYERAFDLFRKAALMGSSEAKHQLFICYYDGKGVQKNVALAMRYLEQAAAAGYEYAVDDLSYLAEEYLDYGKSIIG